jgi:hypothetical protein
MKTIIARVITLVRSIRTVFSRSGRTSALLVPSDISIYAL